MLARFDGSAGHRSTQSFLHREPRRAVAALRVGPRERGSAIGAPPPQCSPTGTVVSSCTARPPERIHVTPEHDHKLLGTLDGGTPVPGCNGGNESPELSWTNAPRGTRSFAIILFDYDASFVHWAIYNIPASRTILPQNAGIAKSAYGQQVVDDFVVQDPQLVSVADYNGPCPPPGFVHHYVFTIYALDDFVTLSAPTQLTSIGDNLPTSETLFDALLHGRCRILASASIIGLYGIPATASPNAVLRRAR